MKSQHTGTIALIVAGLLMLLLAGKSYMDYVQSKYDKKELELKAQLAEQQQQIAALAPPAVNGSAAASGQAQPSLTTVPAPEPTPAPAAVAPVSPDSLPPQNRGTKASAADDITDEELAARRQELELLNQAISKIQGGESPGAATGPSGAEHLASMSLPASSRASTGPADFVGDDLEIELPPIPDEIKRIDPIPEPSRPIRFNSNGSVAASTPAPAAAPIAGPVPDEAGDTSIPPAPSGSTGPMQAKPESIDIRGAVAGGVRQNKGDSPAEPAATPTVTIQEIADQERIIANAGVLAKVARYEREWNVLTITGGAKNNIKVDQRLSVRRGKMIVGYLKVTEVGSDHAIAELTSHNRDAGGVVPQPGDDIISFSLGMDVGQVSP